MHRRLSFPLLVGFLTGALLLPLASATPAAGFGFVTKWGRQGIAPGQFNHPEAVATDRAGNVYVAQEGGSRRVLQKFTARGDFIAQWQGNASMGTIGCGIATDRFGHVYVVRGDKADRHYRVLKFSSRGRLVDQWALLRPRYGRLPGGIATDAAGNVYVAADRWIEKFTATGILLTRWKDPALVGSPSHIFEPQLNGIATDSAGDVYVVGADRITKFNNEGGLLGAWGGGEFSAPVGIATDRAGHVFVSDAKQNRVVEFTSEGAYLSQFGHTGSGNGQFRGPRFLATDAMGDLYVADTSNNRIQKFGEPSSAFNLTDVMLDRRRGSARLVVGVAGVGRLEAVGRGIKAVHRTAKGAGSVVLPIAPDGRLWAQLGIHGRARVKVRITYTPTTPGVVTPASRSKRITLVKNR
jgi:DNA-binding beta-propeller fold protein YncE